MKTPEKIIPQIVDWLSSKAEEAKAKGFVIGVSGGIDSALTSTLCAMTSRPVLCVGMPIHQNVNHIARANEHIEWLTGSFKNASKTNLDLTDVFDLFEALLNNKAAFQNNQELALVNLRSRLRMVALYAFANANNYLVVGTGNKVEDYGVGFFTKYGDGGVDLSPIAGLTKTEVRAFSKHLGVVQSIIDAKPSDGLWNDSRDDEVQIGASYEELEWAMDYYDKLLPEKNLSNREKEVLEIYTKRHEGNKHKLLPPPVCEISE